MSEPEKKKGVSLAEAFGGGKDSQKQKNIQFKNMGDIVSGDRAWKIQIEGEFKCGKTKFCLSILDYLHNELGLEPEEILMIYIDLDNGVIPLVSQGLVDEELQERILYYLCSDFGEVLEYTEEALKLLNEHKKKYGQASAWLVVDNMGKAWEGTRDYYSNSVYGMKTNELLIKSKKKALDRAKQKGKESGRIPAQEFDQMTDYSIINPLHNNWAEGIKDSNINFIWTALLKYEEKEVRGNQRTVVVKPEGQKHNSARVDFIVRKKKEGDLYLTDLIGSRYTSNRFTNEQDMDFVDFVNKIDEMMEKEKKIRDNKKKRLEKERKKNKNKSDKEDDKSEEESVDESDNSEEEEEKKEESTKLEDDTSEPEEVVEESIEDDDDW